MKSHTTARSLLAALLLLPGLVSPALVTGQQPATTPAPPKIDSSGALVQKDPTAAADLNIARALSRAFNRASSEVEPSVVHITQIRTVATRRGFRQQDPQPMAVGAGSGVIMSADGYIVTNHHVIESAESVRVKLADGRELPGRIIGSDPSTDLGVVKIDAEGLRAAQWGESEDLYVGEWVVAIGSPFGQFDNTVTSGIVSAKNRTGLADPRDDRFEDFIQTDAAINPGNSGGPLVNLDGRVVGINSQIATRNGGNVGLGFSIPSGIARPVMDMIIRNNGRLERGWMGIGMDDAMKTRGRRGALVARVVPGSPASKGDLQPNDVIVAFNGREIESANRLRNAIAFTAPGTEVKIDLIRDSEQLTRTVSIVDLTTGRGILPGGASVGDYGFATETLPAEAARQLRLNSQAVIVNYIAQLGSAAEARLQVEDIIISVNNEPVRNAEAFDRAIREARASRIRLDVYRPRTGQQGTITIEPPTRQAD